MRQFSVCRLKGRGGRAGRLVVILQHDLLSDPRTRGVAPLLTLAEADPIGRIAPEIGFERNRFRLCLYVTVDVSALGEPIGSIPAHDLVMRGVDQIFAGI